jgi:hypothetical protein
MAKHITCAGPITRVAAPALIDHAIRTRFTRARSPYILRLLVMLLDFLVLHLDLCASVLVKFRDKTLDRAVETAAAFWLIKKKTCTH